MLKATLLDLMILIIVLNILKSSLALKIKSCILWLYIEIILPRGSEPTLWLGKLILSDTIDFIIFFCTWVLWLFIPKTPS